MAPKKSPIWNFFTVVDNNSAKCNFCGASQSTKSGSTGNLRRHCRTKHPSISLETGDCYEVLDLIADEDPKTTADAVEAVSTGTGESSSCMTKRPNPNQSKITQFARKPVTKSNKQQLDNALLEFVVKDLQAFSLVESSSFRWFVASLNPSYTLPARKTLSKNMLSNKFAELSAKVMTDLDRSLAVCVTTDGWTSRNNDSYIAVTCHFVDVESETIKSVLLTCFSTTVRHTSENIGHELKAVLNNWNVLQKVVAVVTDNAQNMVHAVEYYLKKKHVPCFAHTLNLGVQNGINSIEDLHTKVKEIVAHFKKSTVAANKLLDTQKQKNEVVLKLKQSMPTRWNSSLYMFKRIIEIKESLISTIAVLQLNLPVITIYKWSLIKKICEVLEVFDEVTQELSAEKAVTISKILLIIGGIREHLYSLKIDQENMRFTEIITLITILEEKFSSRATRYETNTIIAEATFLDPRFKKYGIGNTSSFKRTEKTITDMATLTELQTVASSTEMIPSTQNFTSSSTEPTKKTKLWEKFDEKTSSLVQDNNPRAAAIIEVKKYLQEPLLARSENPIRWWNQRKQFYPRLYLLAMARLCVTATSVPSERIFSKAGQLITDRRCRLSGDKVNKILFLNYNL